MKKFPCIHPTCPCERSEAIYNIERLPEVVSKVATRHCEGGTTEAIYLIINNEFF